MFENAFLGEKFRTRDGRDALFIGQGDDGRYGLIVKNPTNMNITYRVYYSDGRTNSMNGYSGLDIILREKDSFDEQRLEDLALQFADTIELGRALRVEDIIRAFKAGFYTKHPH